MKILYWLIIPVFLPISLAAQSINARFSTSFYTWERHLTESESQNYFRIYQTMQATVGQMASNRLSLHLYGLVSQDIAEEADQDPISRLYNAYFKWNDRKGVLQVAKIGRQRLYSGVAYGTMDGVDLTLRLGSRLKLGGFVGLLVPGANEIEISDWDDAHTFGLRASTGNLFGAKAMISFMQRDRRPVAYSMPGRYTQKVLTFESLAQRLLGLDVYRTFGKRISTYGRLDYDLEQERVRRGQFELRFTPSKDWEFSGEIMHRAPLIEANSIFTIFEQNTVQDIGFKATYRLSQQWFINGNFGYIKYEGDQTVRFGFGARCRYGYFGYNFRSGYGGQNNGLYAAFNYPLTQKLGLVASSGFSRYSLFNENTVEYTSLSASVGFHFRPGKHFSFDFLGQGLRNRFYDDDFRFFMKANYWVFTKK